MAVQLALVREHLIDRIHNAVEERSDRDISAETAPFLDDALRRVIEPTRVSTSACDAAAAAARAGYETRVIECETFEAARGPTIELHEAMQARPAGDATTWSEAAASVSAELARAEPAERPHPDDSDAISWRVPGPGGHVRHYLAVRTAQKAPPSSLGVTQLKRCWLYGFLLRCCEEAAPA